ncbi:hypothetical protein HH310_30035 [Actinoplanes sp. TBRC 11911]|uniref:DJ-1/PfpI family protein n=1 Tax=Actinoplanes sp. TBRC 11911 TaxID=2729386 RepID=UPI00145D5593|nr:DJ-1/PfpI family protein [Actinoplanes sp. TBRC 11911]NMO55410.1 hypothetical protein [Actinoplanes sp. TBRC 11911]
MAIIKSIHFLAFPQFGEQDLLAAWELFRSLAWSINNRGESLEVTFGAFSGSEITTHMGAHVRNEREITPDDRFDLLYIPGGIGAGAASKDPAVLDLIRAHHAEGRWVAGNCAGVGVLHRSGILEGREVTTPGTLSRRLAQLGTKVVTPRRAWRVDPENKLFTAGGAGTVHAATIALIWHLFGEGHGRDLAATWDSLPLHGESLFALDGPVMREDPHDRSRVQDTWENVFLPD